MSPSLITNSRPTRIYLIGSLRNPKVPEIAKSLRDKGFEVFDDWFASGPEADDYWQRYEQARAHTYQEALRGYAAAHIYEFDKFHIDRCDLALLCMPCGRSGHLELGYVLGTGKPGYILLDGEPERWDVMYQFAWGVFFSLEECIDTLSAKHSEVMHC